MANEDNTILKSIAVLTMIFLPATFLSVCTSFLIIRILLTSFLALFSTTFFTFGTNGWEASGRIWIYWVITIPLSLAVIFLWRVWSSKPVQKLIGTLSWDMFMPKRKGNKGSSRKTFSGV
jgi:hypothetical protein